MLGRDVRRDTIGYWCVYWVADEHAISNREDVDVEGVVDHVHVVHSGEGPLNAVHATGEGSVCLRERRFPNLDGQSTDEGELRHRE